MSTSIKRIALVAVAALSLGVISVAPSQAAANTLLTFTSGDGAPGTDLNTGNGVAGAFNYVTVTANASTTTDYVVTTDSAFLAATNAVISTDKKSLIPTSNTTSVIQVATPAAGTVTVSYWKRTAGVLAATASETVVITVNASKQSGAFSAAKSSAFIVAGETNTAVAPVADAAVTALSTYTGVGIASIQISLKDALADSYPDTITATVVSGAANVKVFPITDSTTVVTGGVAFGTFSSSTPAPISKAVAVVYGIGTAGPAQIRLTLSDGTILATKTVNFASTTVATLTPTVVNTYISSAGNTGAITVVAKDASGYVIPGAVVTATSGDTTKINSPASATTDSLGVATFNVSAVAAASGSATITFKSGVATTTAAVTAAGVKATKLAITSDVTSAEAGSKITYTMTLADANGPIADGNYVGVFVSAPVTSNGGTGAFAADTVTVLNGKATSSIYLPFVSGTYTSTWTLKGTAGVASPNLDAALTATTQTVSVAVTNVGVDAATDAANEAAQAASDATDAALAAADAADAATTKAQEAVDAVATLSAQVSKLITALKAQITTLTNLVIKIQKKVRA